MAGGASIPRNLLGDQMIRGFLFDVDGILAETAALHQRATSIAAGRSIDCSGGGSTQEKLRRAGVAEAELERIYAHKRRIYQELVSSFEADLALQEMLSVIRRAGYKLAACSNSSTDSCITLLTRLGVSLYFDTVVTGGQVGNLKPAPDAYLIALQRIQVPPTECVVFEDSEEGIQAAKSAGIANVVHCTRATLLEEVKKWL